MFVEGCILNIKRGGCQRLFANGSSKSVLEVNSVSSSSH